MSNIISSQGRYTWLCIWLIKLSWHIRFWPMFFMVARQPDMISVYHGAHDTSTLLTEATWRIATTCTESGSLWLSRLYRPPQHSYWELSLNSRSFISKRVELWSRRDLLRSFDFHHNAIVSHHSTKHQRPRPHVPYMHSQYLAEWRQSFWNSFWKCWVHRILLFLEIGQFLDFRGFQV